MTSSRRRMSSYIRSWWGALPAVFVPRSGTLPAFPLSATRHASSRFETTGVSLADNMLLHRSTPQRPKPLALYRQGDPDSVGIWCELALKPIIWWFSMIFPPPTTGLVFFERGDDTIDSTLYMGQPRISSEPLALCILLKPCN